MFLWYIYIIRFRIRLAKILKVLNLDCLWIKTFVNMFKTLLLIRDLLSLITLLLAFSIGLCLCMIKDVNYDIVWLYYWVLLTFCLRYFQTFHCVTHIKHLCKCKLYSRTKETLKLWHWRKRDALTIFTIS